MLNAVQGQYTGCISNDNGLIEQCCTIFTAGHVDILEWLFQHSLASGLERDDFDTTPVHDAAEEGQIDCLKVFHKYKVDLCCKDMDGFTPR